MNVHTERYYCNVINERYLQNLTNDNAHIVDYLINVGNPVFAPSISSDGSTFLLSVSGLVQFERYLKIRTVLLEQEQASGAMFNYSLTVNPST